MSYIQNGLGGGLIVGTTTISGGAAGQILYDNGGALTEDNTLTWSHGSLTLVGDNSIADTSLFMTNTGTGGKTLIFFSTNDNNAYGGGCWGAYNQTDNKAIFIYNTNNDTLAASNLCTICFCSDQFATAIDSGISRLGAASLAIGNGSNGNVSGTLTLAAITLPGGASPVLATSSAVTSGAGSGAGTLTNAPSAGNPTKWVPFNDGGTIRHFPVW